MRRSGLALWAATAISLGACGSGERSFEAPVVLGGREIAPDVLNRGELLYMRHCRGCHGPEGRGNGRYAASLDAPPADLSSGDYPRLGATGGELPSDAALRQLITEGIEGTAMAPIPLSDENLDAVVHYVKTLAPAWRE